MALRKWATQFYAISPTSPPIDVPSHETVRVVYCLVQRRADGLGSNHNARLFAGAAKGYPVVLPRDAVACVPAEYGTAVIENSLSLLATVTTTDDLLAAWQVP